MSSEPSAEMRVTITNPQGLHLRPADMFARTASGFKSQINLVKDGERVDGKSILSIVTLMATQGTELAIEATGPDATAAVEALVELVEQGFWEGGEDTATDGNTQVQTAPAPPACPIHDPTGALGEASPAGDQGTGNGSSHVQDAPSASNSHTSN